MSKKTLEAGIWLCVNPGSAYAAGVEVTINVEKTTAKLRYEWKNSDSVAPNYIDDISEPIQTLYVKAVDGKGFLWLISQSVDVNIQIESITPAFTTVTFPNGMASETKQDDQITELQAIKTAVQTVAAESDATIITGYIDSVGVRFLTRFDPTATQKITHYRLDDGTVYSPVAPFELISSNVEVFNYVATAAGTGYSPNDILVKFTDTETKSSAWRNETTNLAISSPISGTYGEIGKVGAATETKQDAQIIEAQTLNSNLGTKADSAASSDTGAFSLMSLIKRSLQDWTTFLNRMPSKGQDVAANSLPVVLPAAQITAMTPPTSVSVNNFPATQTISVASLPLPIGAATLAEQQTQTSAQQRIRDAVEKTATAPSGKTPVIGVFSPAVPPAIFQPISSAVFEPIAGRDFNIQVIFGAGVTGNVQLEQSLDGTNFYPLTGSGIAIMRFSSNSVEQWSNNEVGTKFRLNCTAVSGGTIAYRISQ